MTNHDESSNLSDEEKRKKQEEIAERLAEIKNKLSKQPGKKAPKPIRPAQSKPGETPAEKSPPIEEIPIAKKNVVPASKKESIAPLPKKESPPPPAPKKAEQAAQTIHDKLKEAAKKETSSASKVSTPTPTPAASPSKNSWSENQVKPKDKNKEKSKEASEIEIRPMKALNRKKRIRLLVIASTVLLIGVISWFFVLPLFNQSTPHEEPSLGKFDPMIKPKAKPAETASEAEEELTEAEETETAKETAKAVVQKSSHPEKAATSNDKWGLQRPCFVVSYLATGRESKAQTQSQALASKGYTAGYYWIPDYLPSGPSLYKVYIGPFATKAEANKSLKGIQQIKKDAYVQKVN